MSMYESWFRNALISKSVILWWQAKKGINSELEGANACRVLNIPTKRSLYLMRSSHTSTHLQKKSTCSSWTSPHSNLSQMLESPCHLQDSTLKWWRGYKGLQGWPTARVSGWWQIGWWNKINQCRKLKLNSTQTWGVCMSLDSGMHWSQNQWHCDDKPRKE